MAERPCAVYHDKTCRYTATAAAAAGGIGAAVATQLRVQRRQQSRTGVQDLGVERLMLLLVRDGSAAELDHNCQTLLLGLLLLCSL